MTSFLVFLLTFFRFSSFIVVFPLFNIRGLPPHIKIGFAGLLALTVFSSIPIPEITLELGSFIMLAVQEVVIGLVLGFVVYLIFACIYFAGQLIDVPIGFSMATVFDPTSGTQLPLFSQFSYFLAMVVFLAVDGHIWVIDALADSFNYLPINSFFNLSVTTQLFISLSKQIFVIGFKIAAPVMGTLLLVDVALGIITKAVPQINVFVLGFPIKITVGLTLIVIVIPIYVSLTAKLFARDGILLQYLLGFLQSGT